MSQLTMPHSNDNSQPYDAVLEVQKAIAECHALKAQLTDWQYKHPPRRYEDELQDFNKGEKA